MKRALWLILPFCLIISGFQGPKFNQKDTSAMIKASYIYNFSKLIDWPAEYKEGNFVISVMGGQKLYSQLVKRYSDKRIGSQSIEVKKLARTVQFNPCQVLYVGKECSDLLPDIVTKLEGTPTLVIADQPGSLDRGAAINFVVKDHNLKFELSVPNADSHKLFIGSTLKSLALHVENQ